MFFGNIVFSIPDGGLTGGGWAASVCLSLGTFLIGILVRLLPSVEWKDISSYFKDTEEVSMEEAVIDVLPEVQPEVTQEIPIKKGDSSRAHSNWKRAIEKTQMQMKVIKAFQVPQSARTSLSSNTSPAVYRSTSGMIHRESSFVSTIRGGRTNASDYISLQVLDANEVRDKAHQSQ